MLIGKAKRKETDLKPNYREIRTEINRFQWECPNHGQPKRTAEEKKTREMSARLSRSVLFISLYTQYSFRLFIECVFHSDAACFLSFSSFAVDIFALACSNLQYIGRKCFLLLLLFLCMRPRWEKTKGFHLTYNKHLQWSEKWQVSQETPESKGGRIKNHSNNNKIDKINETNKMKINCEMCSYYIDNTA